MPIEKAIECIPGQGCPAGSAVSQVSHDLDKLAKDHEEEKRLRDEGDTTLHKRIDLIDARIWGMLISTVLSLLAAVIGLMK